MLKLFEIDSLKKEMNYIKDLNLGSSWVHMDVLQLMKDTHLIHQEEEMKLIHSQNELFLKYVVDGFFFLNTWIENVQIRPELLLNIKHTCITIC